MRLIRFSRAGAPAEPGLMIGDKAVALSALVPAAPDDMVSVIAAWNRLGPALAAVRPDPADLIALDEVELLAPVDRPEKVLAIGLNYADHVEESKSVGVTAPEHQVWFCKQASCLTGPYAPVERPKVSDRLDYEAELVAVIGRAGRHITREEAPNHVFGYAVGNDVSVRDWQLKTPQWMLGKSFDSHGPVGPALVTADELGDPHVLDITCHVNGELRQSSNTKHLIFDIWDQIAELSQAMTLKPGDMIFTGTPGGVGFAFDPPKPLVPGDVVRCEVQGIGAIENTIVDEV